jgi:hypothetical protein
MVSEAMADYDFDFMVSRKTAKLSGQNQALRTERRAFCLAQLKRRQSI